MDVPRTSASIRIDGVMDDAGWAGAARAENFSESFPGDQTEPPVSSAAWVTYDDENLYLAFFAQDDPDRVRASLRDRDRIWSDDYMGIILDTYGTGSWAYEIFVNPLGVQGDLRWTTNGEDMRFDMVFASQGRLTEEGWQVELAIPFKSLRFPEAGEQRWRATFWRNHPRGSRSRCSWAAIDRDEPCWPCNFGILKGIQNVSSGNSLELLPSVVGFHSSSLRDDEDPRSGLGNDLRDADFSLGARYSISSSLSAEGTFNPDFSQVESDAAQIDVNATFALFFPERRPFFQEGSDLYDTWVDVVYTRSINNPSLASKLTGRLGRSSLAWMGAVDDDSPLLLPFEERSEFLITGKSYSNLFRAQHTYGEDSHIGALLTDRRLEGGGAGTTLGIDGKTRFFRNYRLEYQWVMSHTEEMDDPDFARTTVS